MRKKRRTIRCAFKGASRPHIDRPSKLGLDEIIAAMLSVQHLIPGTL